MSRIEQLRRQGRLQEVPADPTAIERLMADARAHLVTASRALTDGDLAGAYQLGYDAARKALAAMLQSRGLRVRGPGAHANLFEAVREIFEDLSGIERLEPLDRIRRTRNQSEYSGHPFDHDEVAHDLSIMSDAVDLANGVLPSSH